MFDGKKDISDERRTTSRKRVKDNNPRRETSKKSERRNIKPWTNIVRLSRTMSNCPTTLIIVRVSRIADARRTEYTYSTSAESDCAYLETPPSSSSRMRCPSLETLSANDIYILMYLARDRPFFFSQCFIDSE